MIDRKAERQPSLHRTIPYEGVVDEVLSETAQNEAIFTTIVLEKLQRENPALYDFVLFAQRLSPVPSVTVGWMLTYYEIFSRSSQKAHMPIVRISPDVIEQTMETHREELEASVSGPMTQDLVFAKWKMEIVQMKISDIEFSPELAEYWEKLTDQYNRYSRVSPDPFLAEQVFIPVYDFAGFFAKQEVYDLVQQPFHD